MSSTFVQLLLEHAAQRPHAPALREKEYGIWQTQSWAELAELVEQVACGLHQAGLQRGEHMVVVGANRPRLYAAMLAAQSLGAIPIPLYQDAVAAECVFPINNAEVRFAFAEDQEQVDKLLEVRAQCPQLAGIWYDDPRGLRNYDEPGLASVDELVAGGDAARLGMGTITEARLKKTYDMMVANKLLDGTKVDLKTVYTTEFVKDLKIMP